jgi:hypothetical protein
VTGWIIHEWPHSRSLGKRWIAFPPPTPSDHPWPGLRFFDSREETEEMV